jgi:16S rRNA (guanine527-N7)-methyltransferase
VGAELPDIPLGEFVERLQALDPGLSAETAERLHRHYGELRRWNRRLSLVGPGTVREVVERHYGESVVALSLLPRPEAAATARQLLDVGSGAGFPGLVMAVCRPDLRVTLLEPRERKAAFLLRSAHLAAAPVVVLRGFLRDSLPAGAPERLDFVTLRAVKLGAAAWEALRERLVRNGRVLQWSGPERHPPPAGFESIGETLLPGGNRWIRALGLASPDAPQAPPT